MHGLSKSRPVHLWWHHSRHFALASQNSTWFDIHLKPLVPGEGSNEVCEINTKQRSTIMLTNDVWKCKLIVEVDTLKGPTKYAMNALKNDLLDYMFAHYS